MGSSCPPKTPLTPVLKLPGQAGTPPPPWIGRIRSIGRIIGPPMIMRILCMSAGAPTFGSADFSSCRADRIHSSKRQFRNVHCCYCSSDCQLGRGNSYLRNVCPAEISQRRRLDLVRLVFFICHLWRGTRGADTASASRSQARRRLIPSHAYQATHTKEIEFSSLS